MLFRALTLICATSVAVTMAGCVTGETLGGIGCCGEPNAITLDGNPVPGNGDSSEHWSEAWCAERTNMRRIGSTVEYWAFNTNPDYPPYETFYCDQLPRAMYMIGKKFDDHILAYDWDDPFNTCCEPNCDPPKCTMRYVDPCKQRCEPCYEPCYDTSYAPCPPQACDPCPR
jgi:hypothetical protein